MVMNGKEIKQLRYRLDFSQQKFAELLGVGLTTISRWENNKFYPSALALEKLFKIRRKLINKESDKRIGLTEEQLNGKV